MKRYFLPVILCLLFLVLPLNIFAISGNLGVGIQGALYKIQWSDFGSFVTSTVSDLQDIGPVYSGKTAWAFVCWFLGGLFLGLIMLISLLTIDSPKRVTYGTYSGFLFLSGVLFIVSSMLRFGVLFTGAVGFTLPFGAFLILLFAIAILVYPDFFVTELANESG